jgi:hypothetical protein
MLFGQPRRISSLALQMTHRVIRGWDLGHQIDMTQEWLERVGYLTEIASERAKLWSRSKD